MLFAVIAQYVDTGRPVSSKSICATAHMGLSPASIRRTLHELTMAGLLLQPHTSAGRVPTDRAFRVFVNALRDSSGRLDEDTRGALSSGLRELHPSRTSSWRETVRFLSDLSTQTALAITPAVSDSILKQLRFIPLDERRILAVVVTGEGIVHNSYLPCDSPPADAELERIHNYLSEIIIGRTLNEVRALLRRELEDARRSCDELRERASWLGSRALDASGARTGELLVEGRDRLLDQPELEGRLHELMSRLEQRNRILDLLDKAAAADEGPLVIIGREGGDDFDGFAMITAPFGKGGGSGRIGIVGSMRMNYPAMIPLVELSAKLLDGIPEDGEE